MAGRRIVKVEDSPVDDDETVCKAGFLISQANDFKLNAWARKKKKSRSTIVNELLTELLRGVVISFRGKASEEGEAA